MVYDILIYDMHDASLTLAVTAEHGPRMSSEEQAK